MALPSVRQESRRFGKYTLVDRLAVGGMAELFLARQGGVEGFEKYVVLKRIRPQLSKQHSFLRMFLNEAKLAAQLNHPNVVQIYDLGRVGESYFIAMEYLFGRDMRRIIPKAEEMGIAFPMVYALKIASQVCEGLYYAHTKTDVYGNPLGIVHRDVTAENIFVSFDGTVKLLDFGIAKAANQLEHTRAGELKGKTGYMSPEQAMGRPVDCRSDIFSLGTVLYEWITGYQLFTGDNQIAILRAIAEGKIYRPSYFKADLPAPVEAILMRALAQDREQRYASAWEMQSDIDHFLNTYEFTPSNIHLSNFVKQLFFDEQEEEKAKLVAGLRSVHAVPDAASLEEIDTEVTSNEASPLGALSLSVSLTGEQRASLAEVARRNGISAAELAQRVLADWLKYR